MKTRRLKSAALAAALVICAAAAGAGATKKQESKYYPLTILSKVLAHIQASYVEEVDIGSLIYGAIKGMVASLDPHSSYLTPEEYKSVDEELEGKFGGIGLEVDYRYGRLYVIAPLPGTPAEKAGIRSGDEIVAIDGVPAYFLHIQDAARKMRGEPGTKVKVAIRRGDTETLDLEIVREVITIESVKGEMLSAPRKVGLMRISIFQEGTAGAARKLLDSLTAQSQGNLRGLLVDLRGNPGGLLDQAIYIADEFIEKGIILTTRRTDGEVLDTEKAHKVGTRGGVELVLLVNEYTASAAEVLAGALQDNGRATLVGMKTFGKGSIQNIIRLPDGSALKLTTALYATPSGTIIQAHGIEPDFVVPQIEWKPAAAIPSFGEKDLAGHIEAGAKKGGPAPGDLEALAGKYGGDYQLLVGYQYLLARLKGKEAPAK